MIPRPLYEALPYLYFVLGLTAVFSSDAAYGKIAGAALVGAAVVIRSMRKAYRKGMADV